MSTPPTLTLFCIVDGASTSRAFPVKISPDDSIGDLKNLIKAKIPDTLNGVDAKDLTLWHVSNPASEDNDEISIRIDNVISDHKKKLNPLTRLTEVFPEELPEETIHIIVQRPPPTLKRDREKDAAKRLRSHTLMDAICEAGLKEVAVVNAKSDLSLLNNNQRVALLSVMGEEAHETASFRSLSCTANKLKGVKINDMDKLSAPDGTLFPIVDTTDLYVRQTYKHLYERILETFEINPPSARAEWKKHIVVTGTSGIGKSAFLAYFVIRLLAESDDDNPPIIVFHTKRSAECYVFGGRSTVRSGSIEDFKPFLNLPDT
ncbi:hypothetical protein DFQ26_002274, partial [Actinomortierella ambigua]